jgi:iron complex outermembrane receptor protein
MKLKHRRHHTFKAAVLAGASLGVLAAAPALAQEAASEAQTETQDRIVVTGSRIARDPNLTQPTPVQSID